MELATALPSNGFEGIGDDCAVLPISDCESLVFTADSLCEGVHFLRDKISARELGAKSLSVNLSDVAAMGAKPVATMLSISLPKDIDEAWAHEFVEGYTAQSQRYGVNIIGGDTTSSQSGVVVSITAIGRVRSGNIKRRSGAKVGDIIAVTGRLGDSARGLQDMLQGVDSKYVAIHLNPVPRIAQGVWLGGCSQVGAMMDISDGVGSDIRHILNRSGVSARIDLDALPTDHDSHTALCGGEDYELLLTISGADAQRVMSQFRESFQTPITAIGEIVPKVTPHSEVEWRIGGVAQEVDFMGFRHKMSK